MNVPDIALKTEKAEVKADKRPEEDVAPFETGTTNSTFYTFER